MKTLALMTALLLLLVPSAWADQPGVGAEFVTMDPQEPVTLLIYPDGSGPSLTAARTATGAVVDATVRVRLITEFFNPVIGFPPEDVWLETENAGIHTCGGFFLADGPSDADGMMTFSQAYAGGGHHAGTTYVYIMGDRAQDMHDYPWTWPVPGVELHFNSPDINGDGTMDLLDVGVFTADFFGEFAFRSDLFRDGHMDLNDVARFAQGLGTSCP